jgi:hypothetical protein
MGMVTNMKPNMPPHMRNMPAGKANTRTVTALPRLVTSLRTPNLPIMATR